ncbi:ribonuclease H-like domain-containing protein [Rhizophagus clarus]|uniref:Ribonuclease H-like domain-containing protein n=1 Tax=Rhizophagus clarus TaxID=94130 RepID=A0A8H3LNF8_9GLOM|nr:ribonuclease H-like domain-containing protein [Rhizophagus clarus]
MRISVMAYMDDTIFLDHTVESVQESIDIADEFYRIHDIEINDPKTDYIAINTSEERDKCKVSIGFERIEYYPTLKAIRYLGVYFSSHRQAPKIKKIIADTIDDFLRPLRAKTISVGQIEYLVDRILIPRCAYIGQLTSFSEAEWDSLFRLVLKVVKQKCGFASSMPTFTLVYHNIININTPWKIIIERQMDNLCNTLNSISLAHKAIRIRLQTAQLRLGIPKSILTFDIGFLKSNIKLGQHNTSMSTMIRGRMIGIEITQSPKDQLEWSIEGGQHAICTFLHTYKADNLILKFNNHKSKFPLIYFEQIIIGNRTAISWAFFKQLQGNSTRGRVASWYKKLTRFVESGFIPLADESISACRYWTFIEAYLDKVKATSKIKKKDLLLILPQGVEEAPTVGQIHNKGKADSNGCFAIKKVIMKAADTQAVRKLVIDHRTMSYPTISTRIHLARIQIITQYKTNKSICQEWKDICNYDEREVIDENESLYLWDINTMMLEIAISGYDVWIEKWLDDSALQESLMRTKMALQDGWNEPRANRRIEIYTDGSLTKTRYTNTMSHYKNDSHHVSMGAGVYIKDQYDQEFKIAASIRHWPSSTRTEICAILIALIAVPEFAQVVIYTDSQCAIDDITSWNTKSAQAKAKTTNHSGNDEADKLAVEGGNSNLRFTYRIDHSSQDFRYIPTFDGIPIEQPLRKFIARLLNTYNAMKWSLLQCNREFCHTSTRQVAWELALEGKLIGQKELKDGAAMLTRLNNAITTLLGRQANSVQFWKFVKLSMELKYDRAFVVLFREIVWKPRCDQTIVWEKAMAITKQQKHRKSTRCPAPNGPDNRRRGSYADSGQLNLPITQQQGGRASTRLQSRQPDIDHDGNGSDVECYDNPFIAPPVPPPLHTRLDRLIKAVPLTFDAIRKYIVTYVQEPWVDMGKTLRSKKVY